MIDKRDRKALAISLIGFVVSLVFATESGADPILFWLVVLSVYWGYRFVKNDISFINFESGDK